MEGPEDTGHQPKGEVLNLSLDPEDLRVLGLFIYTLKGYGAYERGGLENMTRLEG